jgi:hypothetical protein
MDITRGDMIILAGEGDQGRYHRYYGKRTHRAIRAALTREREHGARWARLWIENIDVTDEDYPDYRVYSELIDTDTRYELSQGGRLIKNHEIITDPVREAARVLGSTTSAKKKISSAENGKLGGRRKHPEILLRRDDEDGRVYALDSETGQNLTRIEACGKIWCGNDGLSTDYEHPEGIYWYTYAEAKKQIANSGYRAVRD